MYVNAQRKVWRTLNFLPFLEAEKNLPLDMASGPRPLSVEMVRRHPEDQGKMKEGEARSTPGTRTTSSPSSTEYRPLVLHLNSPGLTLGPGHFPELKGFPSL